MFTVLVSFSSFLKTWNVIFGKRKNAAQQSVVCPERHPLLAGESPAPLRQVSNPLARASSECSSRFNVGLAQCSWNQ